jgi:nucleoside-diphosphate-sugar epimerase
VIFAPTSLAITGATGFVAKALVQRCMALSALDRAINVLAITRQGPTNKVAGARYIQVCNWSEDTDWQTVLGGTDVLVHAASRVHVMADTATDPLAEFRRVNVQATLHLAREAASAGVKRLVFISSIKVNGESTLTGKPFTADSDTSPLDPYGISKMEAELGLRQIAGGSGMEVVIIRPPLVYGPGVKANFAALMRAVQRGWPLPLGAVHNQRSLVALDNLVDFIVTCITHPQAANQTFLVSDGQDLSTTELVRGMAQAAGVPARLLPVPVWALQVGATLLGKGDAVQRLCGNLQVDISKARNLLGWTPPVSVDEGLLLAMGRKLDFSY